MKIQYETFCYMLTFTNMATVRNFVGKPCM